MPSRSKYPRLLFMIIGALVLIVAFQMTESQKRDEFWIATLQNIGLIALTVVIVEFLWDLAGGDPVQEAMTEMRTALTEVKNSVAVLAESRDDVRTALAELRISVALVGDSQTTGLQRVYATSSSVPVEFWRNQLATATEKVELMGYTLHIWTKTEGFEKLVVEQARRGVTFKLLLMSPDNPQLSAFVNAGIGSVTLAAVTEEIKAAIGAFKAIEARLAGTGSRDNFRVRLVKNGMIVTQICRFDNVLTSVQYLYTAVASRTPLLQISGRKTALFERYLSEFDRMWDAAGTG